MRKVTIQLLVLLLLIPFAMGGTGNWLKPGQDIPTVDPEPGDNPTPQLTDYEKVTVYNNSPYSPLGVEVDKLGYYSGSGVYGFNYKLVVLSSSEEGYDSDTMIAIDEVPYYEFNEISESKSGMYVNYTSGKVIVLDNTPDSEYDPNTMVKMSDVDQQLITAILSQNIMVPTNGIPEKLNFYAFSNVANNYNLNNYIFSVDMNDVSNFGTVYQKYLTALASSSDIEQANDDLKVAINDLGIFDMDTRKFNEINIYSVIDDYDYDIVYNSTNDCYVTNYKSGEELKDYVLFDATNATAEDTAALDRKAEIINDYLHGSSAIVFACEASYTDNKGNIHDNLGLSITDFSVSDSGVVNSDYATALYSCISSKNLLDEDLGETIDLEARFAITDQDGNVKDSYTVTDKDGKTTKKDIVKPLARFEVNGKLYNFYFIDANTMGELVSHLYKTTSNSVISKHALEDGFILQAYYSDMHMLYHGEQYYYNMGHTPGLYNVVNASDSGTIDAYAKLDNAIKAANGRTIIANLDQANYDVDMFSVDYDKAITTIGSYTNPITLDIVNAYEDYFDTDEDASAEIFAQYGLINQNYVGAYMLENCSIDGVSESLPGHKLMKLYKDASYAASATSGSDKPIYVVGLETLCGDAKYAETKDRIIASVSGNENARIQYLMKEKTAKKLNNSSDTYFRDYFLVKNATLNSDYKVNSYKLSKSLIIDVENNNKKNAERRSTNIINNILSIIMYGDKSDASNYFASKLIAYTRRISNYFDASKSGIQIEAGFGGQHTLSSTDESPTLEVVIGESTSGYTPARSDGSCFRYDSKLIASGSNSGKAIGTYSKSGTIEKKNAINYVDIRFKYEYTLPDGLTPDDVQAEWKYEYGYTTTAGRTEKNVTKKSVKFVASEEKENTYITNLVLADTNLKGYYNEPFTCTFSIKYTLDGKPYEFKQADLYSCTRSIKDMIKYYADYNGSEPLSEGTVNYLVELTQACIDLGIDESAHHAKFVELKGLKLWNKN